jgi:hypothetical protein
MKNLLSIPKGHGHYYILSLVLILFIIFPVDIPKELGSLVDSVLGKIVVVVLVLNLFMANPVLGAIGAVAGYELVKRSAGHAGAESTSMAKFIPSEKNKTNNLNIYNQFPVTVEEIVIKNKLPYSFNLSNPSDHASYKPIQDDTHEASTV